MKLDMELVLELMQAEIKRLRQPLMKPINDGQRDLRRELDPIEVNLDKVSKESLSQVGKMMNTTNNTLGFLNRELQP